MSDVSLSIGTSLVANLFASIDYPWRKRIDVDRFLDWDDEIECEVVAVNPEYEGSDYAGEEPDYLDPLIDLFLAHRERAVEPGSPEEALVALFQPYVSGTPSRDTILERMDADASAPERLAAYWKPSLKVSVEWVEFELSKAPNAAMGNPVTLGDLRIAVRAKAKACIRAFGESVCIKITSPWVRFEGKKIEVALPVEGLKVKAHARAHDIDFVIKIKVWKWTYKIRIGMTGYVNKFLSKTRPVLADFGTVKIVVPGLDRTYSINAVAIPSSNSATTIAVDGKFS